MKRVQVVRHIVLLGMLSLPMAICAVTAERDTLEHNMRGLTVKAKQHTHSLGSTANTEVIGPGQLVRAACCNLGESFTTNPSVDVSYSDAATGARQIKLLGLSGTYVQMLTENVPNLRGACIPYSLGFVPGPWMQSIQVSKGASSVKNGYESTTGQINIEFLKPQGTDGIRGNVYLDSKLKLEANLDGSIHLNDRLSTSLLTHFENRQMAHDADGDGFMDMPRLRQYNLMHRWAYVAPHVISQLSMRYLHDERISGQRHETVLDDATAAQSSSGSSIASSGSSIASSGSVANGSAIGTTLPLYRVGITTNRGEAQWKNAYIFQDDRNSSIALILHGSIHDADNQFGTTQYNVNQKNGYAQLLYETDLTEHHNLSVGASVNHDRYDEDYNLTNLSPLRGLGGLSKETTSGLYAQYTYKLGDKLTVMPGLRWDYSSLYGGFLTPRLHVKYSPWKVLTLRASAGKGYRSPHALAENSPLLASGRSIIISPDLKQEEAWNYGLSAALNIPVAGKNLELNAEYYYTHFLHQMVINVDGALGAHTLSFENLDGRSYSHTLQVDATYPFFEGFSATAAFRYNDVRCTYDGTLRRKPLTSRYKGLLTLTYKADMDLWQFDVTGQLNGKGDLYDHTEYPTYFQLQAQVTREFRHCSLYVGGENLTNYRIPCPIINANNPWSSSFDATQVWGPMDGAMAYIGIRIKFEKL